MSQIKLTDFESVQVLCPSGSNLLELIELGATTPFNSSVKEMIKVFSRQLARDRRAREFPELITLARWLRPKAIETLQNHFEAGLPNGTVALGRGVALHFAPGNVDTIFLYSALLSILAGNVTVVRVSSRSSPQMDLLLVVLNDVLAQSGMEDVAARIRVIRYERNVGTTGALSLACDLRVIWGGDKSVQDIRSLPLSPRARDITFSDRWSLTVIDAVSLLNAGSELKEIARCFSNDAYWFGQMGCSSPRLVLWRGASEDVASGTDVFWKALQEHADNFQKTVQPVQYVDKLVAQYGAAIAGDIKAIRSTESNMVSVSQLSSLHLPASHLMHVGGGMFWEAQIQALDDFAPLLDRSSQTIGSFGISAEEWVNWTVKNNALIDRIVPLGQALQFDTIWDGMDLLREFTRLVAIRC